MEVIPAINCHFKDIECVESTLRRAESFGGEWIHLDITDGKFTYNKTWNEVQKWNSFGSPLTLEVHLMIEHPEYEVAAWCEAGAKRLVIHAETITPEAADYILTTAKQYGAEVVLASNPETRLDSLPALLPKFSMYQVLAVRPGFAGQKFYPKCPDKIRELRRMFPDATIEVDGGVNPLTARLAKDAGANILVAASYIFGAEDPKAAYETLKNI